MGYLSVIMNLIYLLVHFFCCCFPILLESHRLRSNDIFFWSLDDLHSILDLFLPCSSSENNKTFVFTNNKWLFLFKLEPNGFKTGKNFFSFVVLVLIWIFWDNGEFHRKKKNKKIKNKETFHIYCTVLYTIEKVAWFLI